MKAKGKFLIYILIFIGCRIYFLKIALKVIKKDVNTKFYCKNKKKFNYIKD